MKPRLSVRASASVWAVMISAASAAPPTSITLDGTLGSAGPVSAASPGFYAITPSMGKTAGSTIFQSFGTFNLGTGDTADFVANPGTQNIIARVTGGSASNLDGTLTSTVGATGPLSAANLFLVNPAGLIFTGNATLHLGGAFVASTAQVVKFSDGTFFYADTQHPVNDAGLSSAPVSAFGFMPAAGQAPASLSFSGTQFTNAGGIDLIAGDISLSAARLLAPGGNICLFSAGSAGSLPFDVTHPAAQFGNSTLASFGSVTLQSGSKVQIDSADGGGQVVIRGGVMVVKGASRITSANSGSAAGGGIEVDAVSLTFNDASNIYTSTTASGAAGQIAVNAQTLDIDGISPNNSIGEKAGLQSQSLGSQSGPAGGITARAGTSVTITGGGEIASATDSSGAAGDVTVTTPELTIDGSLFPADFTGVTSLTEPGATGPGGNVAIQAAGGSVSLSAGVISADTQSAAAAGSVTVTAATLTIDGLGGVAPLCGISSQCDTGASGHGGDISLNLSGAATISAVGEITTASHAAGDAGNITLTAASLTITGTPNSSTLTGISSAADPGSTGAGGNIQIVDHGAMSLTAAGQITADTHSAQDGGSISVQALYINGSLEGPHDVTGITASTDSTGAGGNLQVNVTRDLTAIGGCGIEEETFGPGTAGDLTVNVGGVLRLVDAGFISGNTFGNGTGGSVTVTAPTVFINGAGPVVATDNIETVSGIASNSSDVFGADGTGAGGNVVVNAGKSVTILNGGEIAAFTETRGEGGSVTVNSPNIYLGTGGVISASSTRPGTRSAGQSDAGGVTVNAGIVDVAPGGIISTSAVAADAGTILITAHDLTLDRGQVTTSAGFDGGDITFKVANLFYLFESGIQSAAYGGPATSGGDITLDPGMVVLDVGLISANDGEGTGGKINITADQYLNQSMIITATGGVSNGVVSITAPDLDLGGSLLPLSAAVVSDANELKESCARAVHHDYSSLIVVGRGGTESAPDELQPDFGRVR